MRTLVYATLATALCPVRMAAGYDLLKNKADALTARFRGILREIKEVGCARARRDAPLCAAGQRG